MGSVLKLLPIIIGFVSIGADWFSLADARVEVQCREGEREALLRFKEGFDNYADYFSSWKTTEDCCKWRGVGCNNKTGHVIALVLRDAEGSDRLQGEVRPSLLDLQYLSHLDLSLNNFQQIKIPEFIGNLSSLEYLNLSQANFRGAVPAHLGNLSRLQSLDLSGNGFFLWANNLDWLYGLSSLRVLDLGEIDLSNAVNWLDAVNMLPSLGELHLFSCKLYHRQQVLPSVNFTSLEILDLSYNNFHSRIPKWLFDISHALISLNLTRCGLQDSIPAAFGNFTSLAELDLSYNSLMGSVPLTFGNMTSLSTVDLSFNGLEGPLPANLGVIQDLHQVRHAPLSVFRLSNNDLNGSLDGILAHFPNLVVLDVSSNSLGGVITEGQLLNFGRLKVLDLSGNRFILNISSNWIPPFQLETLGLQSCQVGPQFPQWLENQTKVVNIDISNAGIVGHVPKWFWNLSSSIEHLNLSYNQLVGEVPDLSSRVNLLSLHLGSNMFSGLLPHFPPKISSLVLYQNNFIGPISPICGLMNRGNKLVRLDLFANSLSGYLPDCWTYGQHLAFLDLGMNNFGGKIPPSLINCSSLVSLNLGDNVLSGSLPAWFGENLENLQILVLGRNNIHGNIPLEICQLKYVIVLDLSFNSFAGAIPRCINNFLVMAEKEADRCIQYYDYTSYTREQQKKLMWNLQNFRGRLVWGLDLSSNDLIGEIPREVVELVGVIVLNLSNNNLRGFIPCDMGAMKNLEALDLSRNQLSHAIPVGMTDLTFLAFLNLSYNHLSGKIPGGKQFDTFGNTSYLGNENLCGIPVSIECPKDQSYEQESDCSTREPESRNHLQQEYGHDADIPAFYMGMTLGYVVSFWGFWAALFFSTSWRYAYFSFLNRMGDKIYVLFFVTLARLHRKFHGEPA